MDSPQKYEITIRHNNFVYTCIVRRSIVSRIIRTMEDSGINDEVDFNSLSPKTQNAILNRIANHDRH